MPWQGNPTYFKNKTRKHTHRHSRNQMVLIWDLVSWNKGHTTINEPQREETFLLSWALNDSNQPAPPRSLIGNVKKLCIVGFPNCAKRRLWSERASAQADLNLFLAHISDAPFSDVVAQIITKTYLYNFDPLKPHFYIVKLGLQGYTLLFLFLFKNIDCGYSLEPPRRGGSNEYLQSMHCSRNMKNIRAFLYKIFYILEVKYSIYLK